jgi:hypothetical protein
MADITKLDQRYLCMWPDAPFDPFEKRDGVAELADGRTFVLKQAAPAVQPNTTNENRVRLRFEDNLEQ